MADETDRPLHALPLEERLKTYRRFADEALQRAAQVHDWEVRTGLLAVAAKWQSLAAKIEKVSSRLDSGDTAYDRDREGDTPKR